jgi:GcrA cell cycle regulator
MSNAAEGEKYWNTPGRIEQLTKLWESGLSASLIATEMGATSKNAVIGKAGRLKLGSRKSNGLPTRSKNKKALSKDQRTLFNPRVIKPFVQSNLPAVVQMEQSMNKQPQVKCRDVPVSHFPYGHKFSPFKP